MDRVRVRDRDRRSEPNLRLLSTKTYHISYGGPYLGPYGGPNQH